MQDGFIFNDTIANNIAVSDANPNYEKLVHACTVANILPFIESLPLVLIQKLVQKAMELAKDKNKDYL
jgi:ATP-binding cassette subfamily B protein